MENNSTSFGLRPAAQRRLVKDIVDIVKNPLTNHGIYYVHDEENMLRGYALIFGPEDSVYEHGVYLFRFKFPPDYPFKPPRVTFMTKDQRTRTRFNPNLYTNGKVCVSLLNTWKGEQWTSCQTIRSVLLALVTLFGKDPLLNEPGVTRMHKDVDKYTRLIRFKNYQVAICDILSQHSLPEEFVGFMPVIRRHLTNKKADILSAIKKGAKSKDNGCTIDVDIYNMHAHIDYNQVGERFRAEMENKIDT